MSVADRTIDDFLSGVASESVTPSGGAVAAICGACGAALCEMACIHTIGSDGSGSDDDSDNSGDSGGSDDSSNNSDGRDDAGRGEITGVCDDLGVHRTRLSELADEDVAAVDDLQATFEASGSETEVGNGGDDEAIARATKRAVSVPLATAEACLGALDAAAVVTERANRNVVPDAGTGAFLAYGALRSSVSTARHNIGAIEDATFVAETERRSDELEAVAGEAIEQVVENVDAAH
jgi:formiminotetrahydrofolate cyclodeaminase